MMYTPSNAASLMLAAAQARVFPLPKCRLAREHWSVPVQTLLEMPWRGEAFTCGQRFREAR